MNTRGALAADAFDPAPEATAAVPDATRLRSAVRDLYGVIAALDAEQQSDIAGRLHALTLELRERIPGPRDRYLT